MANEEDYNYLTERIGKITNALYKVTDFLPDKEPLKWSLRESSVVILINIVSLGDKDSRDKVTSFGEIFDALNKTIYMLDLASLSGFIAGLNFEILKKEYEKIGELIETDKKEEILFSDKLFPELSNSVHKTGLSGNGQLNSYNGQYKGQSTNKGQGQNMSVTGNHNGHNSNKNQLLDAQKDNQVREIIEFIRVNGHVTIKDISSRFPKISQKTIQRRLSHGVDIGLLEKEGDKRWRRYFVSK